MADTHTKHQGGEGKVTISNQHPASTITAAQVDMYVTGWSADETRKTKDDTTTGNYDATTHTVFESETEVGRRLEFQFDAFIVDEIDYFSALNPVLAGHVSNIGPVILQERPGVGMGPAYGISIGSAQIRSIKHNPGKVGEDLQMFSVTASARGIWIQGALS